MESFSYESLLKVCEILGIDIKDAKKMDISKGDLYIYLKNRKEVSIPIKQINNLSREDCKVCYDLTSESSDISIGSIGSPSEWNTVIIRTEKGKILYEKLIKCDLIESKSIEEVKPGLPLVLKIAASKKDKCLRHILTKKNENKKVPHY